MLGRNELIWGRMSDRRLIFLDVHLRYQLHVSYLLTMLICFEQLAYHVPHVCQEKLGLQEEDIVELSQLPLGNSLQHTEASEPDWSVKFAEQVEAWNARRMNYLCSLQKLIDLGVVQLHVEVDTVHGVVVEVAEGGEFTGLREDSQHEEEDVRWDDHTESNALESAQDDNITEEFVAPEEESSNNRNYNVHSRGLRLGKRPIRIPSI